MGLVPIFVAVQQCGINNIELQTQTHTKETHNVRHITIMDSRE